LARRRVGASAGRLPDQLEVFGGVDSRHASLTQRLGVILRNNPANNNGHFIKPFGFETVEDFRH
jgi:hypothetical protein